MFHYMLKAEVVMLVSLKVQFSITQLPINIANVGNEISEIGKLPNSKNILPSPSPPFGANTRIGVSCVHLWLPEQGLLFCPNLFALKKSCATFSDKFATNLPDQHTAHRTEHIVTSCRTYSARCYTAASNKSGDCTWHPIDCMYLICPCPVMFSTRFASIFLCTMCWSGSTEQ